MAKRKTKKLLSENIKSELQEMAEPTIEESNKGVGIATGLINTKLSLEITGNPGIGTASIEEEKPKKEPKHIKITMIRNYKVSYKSGYLLKAQTYNIKDVEGGMKTAEKLVNSGWAKWADNSKVVSQISNPVLKEKVNEEDKISREDAIRQLREKARNRRG